MTHNVVEFRLIESGEQRRRPIEPDVDSVIRCRIVPLPKSTIDISFFGPTANLLVTTRPVFWSQLARRLRHQRSSARSERLAHPPTEWPQERERP
jgi:hypothetical protein